MKSLHKLYSLILLGLTAMVAMAAGNDVVVRFYDRWDRLPGDRLLEMGWNYQHIRLMPDSALLCYSIVANRYYKGHQSHDEVEQSIRAMVLTATLYQQDFYDYTRAYSYNLQARELAEKHQCHASMPFILLNDANISGLVDDMQRESSFSEEKLSVYKKAFAMAREQKNWNALHSSFNELIICTLTSGKEALIDREMDFVRRISVPDTALAVKFKYDRCLIDGIRAWKGNDLDSAFNCFDRLLTIAGESHLPRERAFWFNLANSVKAIVYEKSGQYDKAIQAIEANEANAKAANFYLYLLDSYYNQEHLYRLMGDERKAEHYHLLYLEGKDSLLTEKRLGSVQETRFLYQLNRKNEQVRELAAREQLQHKVMWGALVFSLVLLVLMALLVVSYRRVQRHNRYLYEKSLDMIRAGEQKHELVERLQQAEVLAGTAGHRDEDTTGTVGKMDEDKMSDLLHRVFIVMETSHEIYSPDFSLPRLAELVGDRRNNVSEAINRRYKSNFNGLLNEYRIREACRRINDPEHYGNLTIEAIGQSVGFKSRSAFSTIFKQQIGLTPGTYQRQARTKE